MRSADIAVTMMTMDRTPRTNYLTETLENFTRAGGFTSPRFHSLHIVDSGSPPESQWPDRGILNIPYMDSAKADFAFPPRVFVHRSKTRRAACLNAAAALEAGLKTRAPWILFCEDDLDFCGDFLDSVGRWLDLYGDPRYHIFAFGCAYPQVMTRTHQRAWTWEYPVNCFYGTQCFAIRREEAESLAAYWNTNPKVCDVYSPSAYDLMLQDWHRATYPDARVMLASAPSFVQHIGRDSIATSKEQTHTFPSWPGAFWAFDPEVVRV